MGAKPIVHRLTARNTATASPNRIHDADTARDYGFAGGLVPGVTVFAWMCEPALDAYGAEWLGNGTIEARFARPVYDGDEVSVEGAPDGDGLALAVRTGDEPCATGRATAQTLPALDVASFLRVPIPAAPPPASPSTLESGTALGTVEVVFEARRAREYLAAIGADHESVARAGVAHPGWLLLLANLALSANVTLGPWIHVSSDVRLHDMASDGEPVSALARVAGAFERKGHRFVELDVVMVASEARPIASVRHVAIYEPRRPER